MSIDASGEFPSQNPEEESKKVSLTEIASRQFPFPDQDPSWKSEDNQRLQENWRAASIMIQDLKQINSENYTDVVIPLGRKGEEVIGIFNDIDEEERNKKGYAEILALTNDGWKIIQTDDVKEFGKNLKKRDFHSNKSYNVAVRSSGETIMALPDSTIVQAEADAEFQGGTRFIPASEEEKNKHIEEIEKKIEERDSDPNYLIKASQNPKGKLIPFPY